MTSLRLLAYDAYEFCLQVNKELAILLALGFGASKIKIIQVGVVIEEMHWEN